MSLTLFPIVCDTNTEGPWGQDRGPIIRMLTMDADLSTSKERVQELRLYRSDGG